jgi:hypothetical protein
MSENSGALLFLRAVVCSENVSELAKELDFKGFLKF